MSALGLVSTGLGNQLAVALAPTLRAIAEAVANVAQRFNELSPSMKQIIATTAAAAAALGPLAIGLGFVVSGISAVVGIMGSLRLALFTLRGALISTGIGALVVGAGLLIDFLLRLRTATGSWGSVLEVLGDLAAGVWDGIKTSAQSIAPALGAIWKDVEASFYSLLDNVTLRWAKIFGQSRR